MRDAEGVAIDAVEKSPSMASAGGVGDQMDEGRRGRPVLAEIDEQLLDLGRLRRRRTGRSGRCRIRQANLATRSLKRSFW